jgi:putative ABC transport system ATP-binding protein
MAGVRFRWPGDPPFSIAIDDFTVARGERVLLLGPSGSGKSTLLALLCGIVTPDAGRIEVLGTDLARLPGAARDRFRAEHFGVIFQMFNLLPWASALDNVRLGLAFAPARRARLSGRETAAARQLLTVLGLPDPVIAPGPSARLSVGQQQRVAVARALIGAPEVIVADEPTSALDAATGARFLEVLFDGVRSGGATLLMVSHDERLAPRFDRTVRLADIAGVERAAAA